MAQPIYECPFCDAPAWRTRYMLWRHMHECIRKESSNPVVGIKSVDVKPAEMVLAAQ